MFKGCLSVIVLLLAGLYYGSSPGGLSFLQPLPGQAAEHLDSPSGRFTAQVWRCCDWYNYITGFTVRDREIGTVSRQNLADVEGLGSEIGGITRGTGSSAGGITFEWTPTENYLVIVTDNRVTSHGCNELLVYTGDGSALVYSSVRTSICRQLMTDYYFLVVDLCANDDIILSSGERVTPSTGVQVQTGETSCGDE